MISFWFDEFERINRMIRDLTESPTQQILRQLEQQRQLLEPPGYRALRELQDNIVAEARRVNESLTSGFSSLVGQYDVLKSLSAMQHQKDLVADLRRSLRAFQPPALPFIESFAAQIRSASRSLEALRVFQETFAGQLLDLAYKVAEASEEEIEGQVEKLSDFIGTHLAKSKRGPISLEGYVQIILAPILYIHSILGAQQSVEQVMKRLNHIEAQLKAIAPVEPVKRAPELRLVAAASLRIRAEPSMESKIIGKLTRNSLVRVITKEKSWVRIEYFDFVDGSTSEGWVAHRFLQELPNDFRQGTNTQRTETEKQAARERFERHFGEVDLGYATGVDNEQIDADLATEYAATHEVN
jgi:uncharacterized protein YgiM (DUF1202 family)